MAQTSARARMRRARLARPLQGSQLASRPPRSFSHRFRSVGSATQRTVMRRLCLCARVQRSSVFVFRKTHSYSPTRRRGHARAKQARWSCRRAGRQAPQRTDVSTITTPRRSNRSLPCPRYAGFIRWLHAVSGMRRKHACRCQGAGCVHVHASCGAGMTACRIMCRVLSIQQHRRPGRSALTTRFRVSLSERA